MSYYNLKDNTVLCHYGVPGMKWGVRNSANETPNNTAHAVKGMKWGVRNLDDEKVRQGKSMIDIIIRDMETKKFPPHKKIYRIGDDIIWNTL